VKQSIGTFRWPGDPENERRKMEEADRKMG
jgi:hypothetical protein